MEPMYIYTTARQIKQWYLIQEELTNEKPVNANETDSCGTCCRKEEATQKE